MTAASALLVDDVCLAVVCDSPVFAVAAGLVTMAVRMEFAVFGADPLSVLVTPLAIWVVEGDILSTVVSWDADAAVPVTIAPVAVLSSGVSDVITVFVSAVVTSFTAAVSVEGVVDTIPSVEGVETIDSVEDGIISLVVSSAAVDVISAFVVVAAIVLVVPILDVVAAMVVVSTAGVVSAMVVVTTGGVVTALTVVIDEGVVSATTEDPVFTETNIRAMWWHEHALCITVGCSSQRDSYTIFLMSAWASY